MPGAEYDRDPGKIETQARIIVSAPRLIRLARELQQLVADDPDDAPAEIQDLAALAAEVLRYIVDVPPAPAVEAGEPAKATSAA